VTANRRKPQSKNDERMLHIRMSADMHRHVRVRAAEADATIQDWMIAVIERELNRGATDGKEAGQ